MKNKTELELALEYYESDSRKEYSAQRIEDKPGTFLKLVNSKGKEKNTGLLKVYYVKNEVKKILRNKLEIYSISENNQLYSDVLKVQSGVLNHLDDIRSELKEELNILVNDISDKIIDTLKKIESQPVKLIKPSDLDDFEFHDLRHILENKVYLIISRTKNAPRGQIYIYRDINIYDKLRIYYDTDSDGNLDELVSEFLGFYNKNEELFIKRYKENEELGDSCLLNLELALLDEKSTEK